MIGWEWGRFSRGDRAAQFPKVTSGVAARYNPGAVTVVILLASRSRSRAKLLADAGLVFEQISPPFQDPSQPVQDCARDIADAGAVTVGLARRKAKSIREAGLPAIDQGCVRGAVILSADTVVVAPDRRLLGQPESPRQAREILDQLIGAVHQIVTGVCLLDPAGGCEHCFYDSARVRIGPIAELQLSQYLESGQWRHKAGGYNYEDLRNVWPIEVEGDPATVVGLPKARLRPVLEDWPCHGAQPFAARPAGSRP